MGFCLADEDFPPLSQYQNGDEVKAPVSNFSGILTQLSCTPKEHVHPLQDGKLSQSFRLHAVTFQVASSSPFVPQTFLPLLLAQLWQVDKTSALLPQPEAAEHVKRLCYSKDFQPRYRPFLEWESYVKVLPPKDGQFVGKFWMSSNSKFSSYKSNRKFKAWTKHPTFKISFQAKVSTKGQKHIGLLLHALPRADLIDFVKLHLLSKLQSLIIPDFHLEVKTLYRKNIMTMACNQG